MGREGVCLDQPSREPVDVSNWRADEEFALVYRLLAYVPQLREHINNRLESFDIDAMRDIIMGLTAFKIPIPLSEARATFVARLTESRYQHLVKELNI